MGLVWPGESELGRIFILPCGHEELCNEALNQLEAQRPRCAIPSLRARSPALHWVVGRHSPFAVPDSREQARSHKKAAVLACGNASLAPELNHPARPEGSLYARSLPPLSR